MCGGLRAAGVGAPAVSRRRGTGSGRAGARPRLPRRRSRTLAAALPGLALGLLVVVAGAIVVGEGFSHGPGDPEKPSMLAPAPEDGPHAPRPRATARGSIVVRALRGDDASTDRLARVLETVRLERLGARR